MKKKIAPLPPVPDKGLKEKVNYDGQMISEDVLLYILRLHAQFAKPEQIRKILVEDFGNSSGSPSDYFNHSLIRINKLICEPKSKMIIATYRAQYLNKIKDVGISHKKVRLEDLDEVRGKMMERIKENKLKDKEEVREFMELVKGLNMTMTSARDEMEGKSIVLNQMNIMGDFGDKSDDELISRRDELIRQAEIAITGRTSGINHNPEGAIPAEVIKSA